MFGRKLVVCLVVLLVSGSSPAGIPPQEEAQTLTQVLPVPPDLMAQMAEMEAGALPKFEEVTKDMVSKEGLFTLWYYPPDKEDKDQQKLLCQIPKSFLGEKFMLSTSFAGGGFLTGFPWEERVVQWELLDRQLLLIEPQSRFVIDEGKTVADVVRRTHPDRIRAAVPLVTKSPAGDPVIDLGPLLKSDFADISWMAWGMGSINPSLSKWTKRKAFELNVEIGVELALSQANPPGSYDKKLIHYSFWKLPKTDYQPRVADDRVGYFVTANQDWSKPSDARDLFNRYVNRWNLQKRDPSLQVCEPKKPIVFYIEKTVPVRYRRAVRDGILEWNEAFEKVGFASAVQVRQQTEDNEWKDLDPEDMRYSFIRWIVSGMSFAMGPSRVNPFTGEIYDADILFDDSLVRSFEREAQRMLPSTQAAYKWSNPVMLDFVTRFPQWGRPACEWTGFAFGEEDDEALYREMRQRLHERGGHFCEYAHGMQRQMALAGTVLAGQPKEVTDRFLYDVIKETVMHEVGHTLGLRHNFKASTVYSLDEIQKRKGTGQPTCGSVMDYNPVLFFKEDPTEGHFITPTLGPYDYWAIEYGYRPADGTGVEEKKAEEEKGLKDATAGAAAEKEPAAIPKELFDKLPPEARKLLAEKMKIAGQEEAPKPTQPAFAVPASGEEAMLAKIASRAAEPELAFGSDEDATMLGPDPRVCRFDMGSDPIEWARQRIDLVNDRMSSILDWSVKDEESWYHMWATFTNLLIEKAFVLDYVGRYVGGQNTSRAHRGDPDAPPPFTPVPAEQQREALNFIANTLFTDEFFAVQPDVLNHLTAPRWWHEGTWISMTVDYPIHEWIGLCQWWNLFDRLMPNTLRRIHDAEMKTDEADRFTVAEYLQKLQNACWGLSLDASRLTGGEWTDSRPFISSTRRSLQREWLGLMEPLVRTPPGLVLSPDLHAMVQQSLRKLRDDICKIQAAGQPDFASQAHLESSRTRIEQMLAPELDEYAPVYSGG